jgi:sialic acid synthase SpsE
MNLSELINSPGILEGQLIKPYIIAEAGVNHEANMSLARQLIEEALEGGANAIKFQSYKANTLASIDAPAYWDTTKEPTQSQFKLFQKYDKFWKDEFEELKLYCDRLGIDFLSTPFDIESANFLNDMMDVFKISSSDITNKPFIEHICGFDKPIILSTGASYLYEIQEAVDWIDSANIPVALLHCILNYPTDDENANLGMIKDLQKNFPDKVIGYSDHTLPNDMSVLEMAVIMGASIIEKHFTFDKTLTGNDHYHSMDKNDLKIFNKNLDRLIKILGSQKKYPLKSEEVSRKNARRSLVALKNIPKGSTIMLNMLTWKRPASGISPVDINKLIGMTSTKDILQDEILQWTCFHE